MNTRGYITLLSVLILGAVGTAIATALLLFGVGFSRTSYAITESSEAKALVNACAEEALEQIRLSTLFTGSGNLSFGSGTCGYSVTSQGGQNRTIQATSTKGAIVRKVKIVITQITPLISVSTWQEIADF